MPRTTARTTTRRSGRLSSAGAPPSLLDLVDAEVSLEGASSPAGRPASGTSGESTPDVTFRLGSKGGESPGLYRGRQVTTSFLQSTCCARVGLSGTVCETPKDRCAIRSHKSEPKEQLPQGAILSISGNTNGDQVSLSRNQSEMLHNGLDFTPDSVKSTNEDSPHSNEDEYADWTSSKVLAEAARLESDSDRSVLIKTEEDSDYWEGQCANSMSDYYSTNGSSIKEPEDESLELSDSLVSADELGRDSSGRSRRLAKRRKLSSTSTSYSLEAK